MTTLNTDHPVESQEVLDAEEAYLRRQARFASMTEAQWIALHKLDEDIVYRAELLVSTYHNADEADYERALAGLLLLLSSRP
jgi:hypothetical protein